MHLLLMAWIMEVRTGIMGFGHLPENLRKEVQGNEGALPVWMMEEDQNADDSDNIEYVLL